MKTITLGTIALALFAAPLGGCDVEDETLEERVSDDEYYVEPEGDQDATPQAADALTVAHQVVAAVANFFQPVGTLDRADCNRIAGWVKDGDTTAPTWASIRTAPWPGGSQVATPLANIYRGDLPFPDKNHGFNIATPAWLKDGRPHTIYVHGINVDGNGDWDVNANSPLLNLSGRTFCCGTGCFDGPDDGPDIPDVP